MEGLSGGASVIAVFDISFKIISLCSEYASAVRYAKVEVESLTNELKDLTGTFLKVQKLVEGSDATTLLALQPLLRTVESGRSQLENLVALLEPSKKRQAMQRFGFRAFKWPFVSTEVKRLVQTLEKYKTTISLALNADSLIVLLSINKELDHSEQERLLNQLAYADGAAFNSEPRRNETGCLPNTRVELLKEIEDWIETGSCPIFWLSGMAGTGKSTIAWTVASRLLPRKKLAASFFFSRGAGDLGRTSKLVTTIACQLADLIPSARQLVCKAIDSNKYVVKQTFRDQWTKLILQPMQALGVRPNSSNVLVLVVDALDECGDDEDMRQLIQLFTESRTLVNIRLLILLTSRPETSIRLGFEKIGNDLHQDLKLHDIARSDIQHDICVYFQHEFAKLSADWVLPEWPGMDAINELVRRSDRLFIYAATVCRFLRYPPRNPQKRLRTVLAAQTGSKLHTKQLDELYTQVLDNAFVSSSEDERADLALSFRHIVGCVILLHGFLGVPALSRLTHRPIDEVDDTLEPLHAVLVVPDRLDPDAPVRLLHPSFRDFLLDKTRCSNRRFHIDRSSTDADLARMCLREMSSRLIKDICKLERPGTLATEVPRTDVEESIPPELQYACSYWVRHLGKTALCESDVAEILSFLEQHLLHWIEALSFQGKTSEAVLMLSDLCSLVKPQNNDLHRLAHDAHRFILANFSIIELAPLQTYCAALMFAPSGSLVRRLFEKDIPIWIRSTPATVEDWDSLKQTIEGHSDGVESVVFSPDGSMFASCSVDKTIRLWDTATGKAKKSLAGHSDRVISLAFSPDGSTIASGSYDKNVRLWDTVTGKAKQTLKGQSKWVMSVAFSPDGSTVASGSHDNTARLWDTATGNTKQTLEGHFSSITSVAFSRDGSTVVSGSYDKTVRIWHADTGKIKQSLEGHSNWVTSVVFSPDGSKVASSSWDKTVRLWEPAIGKAKQTLERHSSSVTSVVFSPNGSTVASSSLDSTVRLWDAATGIAKQVLEGHSSWVVSVVFSPDGRTVASGSHDSTVRLWCATTGKVKQTFEGHSDWVMSVAFSPDGSTVASGSVDRTVQLWDAAIGSAKQKLEGHSDRVTSVVFSPDSSTIASGSWDETVRLWDAATGKAKQTHQGYSYRVTSVVFLPDGSTVASGLWDGTVRQWDTATGKAKGSNLPKSLQDTLSTMKKKPGKFVICPRIVVLGRDGSYVLVNARHGGSWNVKCVSDRLNQQLQALDSFQLVHDIVLDNYTSGPYVLHLSNGYNSVLDWQVREDMGDSMREADAEIEAAGDRALASSLENRTMVAGGLMLGATLLGAFIGSGGGGGS